MENNKALTMTVFIKATANYGESLGNVAMVQKVFRNGKVYAVRTKESMKYAIGAQSGLSDGLQIKVDGAAQKEASPKNTAQNQRWLEAGYMTQRRHDLYAQQLLLYYRCGKLRSVRHRAAVRQQSQFGAHFRKATRHQHQRG